jgi:hypothetical protein
MALRIVTILYQILDGFEAGYESSLMGMATCIADAQNHFPDRECSPAAHSSPQSLGWQEEEGEGKDKIDGEELQALEPIGPSVARDLSRDERGQKNHENQSGCEG